VKESSQATQSALRFVILIGIISLFADFTYEGARSINGQFLETLGASAAAVGFIAGFGELIGYGLRFVFGYIADKTRRYWLNALVGYTINLLAIPALALAGNWPVAAALIIAERTGRAIRKPAVEAMLSYAGSQTGQGWAFGLHEALDQAGATIGPLVMSLVLILKGSYRIGYALLLVSALLSLATIMVARHYYPKPHILEKPTKLQTEGLNRTYCWYMAAAACIAAGFADFALVGYHLQKSGVVSSSVIPLYYAVAMGVGAIGALILGRLFDKNGVKTILASFLLSAFFAPLVFLGDGKLALLGMVLWGLGMAAQETLLKPLVAGIITASRRATAFGLFDTGFGVAWFLGSWLMGYLYGRSIRTLVIFSVAIQLLALPIFWFTTRNSEVKQMRS
jgi:predicted MFS family arabinose efflux permease